MDNFDKLREVTTVESFIFKARLSELHLAIRQLLEGPTGTLEQVQQLQSLSALAVDALVKRCTSGEVAEPVLELFRSVHGAHLFPNDGVARKRVAQLEVWKRLSDAIREFESLGPDLPKRAAALVAEAKVMEFSIWPRPSPKTPASSSWAPRSNSSGTGSTPTPSQSARR